LLIGKGSVIAVFLEALIRKRGRGALPSFPKLPSFPNLKERRLVKTRLIRPKYVESFRCIGPACEDSCCAGWAVAIDQATYDKYQTVPAGPLRTLIDANILRTPEGADGSKPAAFAQIKMPPSRQCPFHNTEQLCQIQVEHGETYLSRTCAEFPRTARTIDGFEETSLTLSCPEAARLVLMNPTCCRRRARATST